MAIMSIREATPADRPAQARIWIELFPYLIITPESLAARITPESEAEYLVWDEDGEILATAISCRDILVATANAWHQLILVRPEHRKKGIGTALQEAIDTRLRAEGAAQVVTRLCDPDGFAFAEAHGFEQTRTERISSLDLADLPDEPELPEGVTIQTMAETDPQLLYAVELATVNDIPGDDWKVETYEEWIIHLDEPRLDKEASTVLVEDGRAIAVAWLDRGTTNVWSNYTAVIPDARGRGLARAVKVIALRRAAAAGATVAFTNNDAENAPMLAVNVGMGYTPFREQRAYLRKY